MSTCLDKALIDQLLIIKINTNQTQEKESANKKAFLNFVKKRTKRSGFFGMS